MLLPIKLSIILFADRFTMKSMRPACLVGMLFDPEMPSLWWKHRTATSSFTRIPLMEKGHVWLFQASGVRQATRCLGLLSIWSPPCRPLHWTQPGCWTSVVIPQRSDMLTWLNSRGRAVRKPEFVRNAVAMFNRNSSTLQACGETSGGSYLRIYYYCVYPHM